MFIRQAKAISVATGTLLALSISGVAMAGGTPAGGASGATISGSSSIPSASMSFFSGSLTRSGGGSSTPASVMMNSPSIPTPPSLSGLLSGFSPGSQVTLRGPSGTFTVTIGSGGTIDNVSSRPN